MLLQSDMFRRDPELDGFVAGVGPYDCLTLWFNGAHPARQHDVKVERMDLGVDSDLRMCTDVAALEHAGAMVRPGGLFHLALRGMTNHPPTFQAQVTSEMRSLAQHGPVSLIDVSVWPYEEPSEGQRIGVGAPGSGAQTMIASVIFTMNQSR